MTINSEVETAADKLLNTPTKRSEESIRSNISQLLYAMGIDHFPEYPIADGRADIYLPRRRVFIEAKAFGKADDPHRPQSRKNQESPLQQVQRYLVAERDAELDQLPLEEETGLQWTGIVTDGKVWHTWHFPHKHLAAPFPAIENFRPQSGKELLSRLAPVFQADPVGKPWIPANPVALFKESLSKLRKIYDGITGDRLSQTTETKRRLWLDMLSGSGMVPASLPAQVRLFTAHCFLTTLARGVVHTLLAPAESPDPEKLLGNGYPAWIIELEPGRQWAKELLECIHRYEWRKTRGDVLRPLYEEFVNKSDCNDFGEVYTPDWLAEMMVREVLDEKWCKKAVLAALDDLRHNRPAKGIGVLDPTCGSGTFLYHCARRILESKTAVELQATRKSDVVCHLVHGIDINPVAVEFSRATLLRALPASPSGSDLALAVYQGDALMLRQQEKNTLFKPRNGEIVITSPKGHKIFIPQAFSEHAEFPDMLRRIVNAAVVGKEMPADIGQAMGDVAEDVLACHKVLVEIIKDEGNSVWTWYITNVLGPNRLSRRKIDRIVANPPWVKLSNIQVKDRKRALENMAGKGDSVNNLELWDGGKQAPHFDIAQLFIRRIRESYLGNPEKDPSAWVTKASAIQAGNWKSFRDWHKEFLAQVLDLSAAKVFGGGDARRSCVLFEKRKSSLHKAKEVEAVCHGKVPDASMSWKEAHSLLALKKAHRFSRWPSDYKPKQWRQGATVTPKVLTEVDSAAAGPYPDVKTVKTQSSSKAPWKDVATKTGDVPAHWLAPLLTSQQLLPFGVASGSLRTVIIPRDKHGNLLSTDEARDVRFWQKMDELWAEFRGLGGNTPETLIDRIDYSGGVSVQLPLGSRSRQLVIYPASGDIMRAARMREGEAIIDSKVYYAVINNITEAHYLVAVMNAPSLGMAFKHSRGSGRDFHKSPWKSVPVPNYDKNNKNHRALAGLARRAEKAVEEMELPDGQIAASKKIREQLDKNGISVKIDALVREILPHHTKSKD